MSKLRYFPFLENDKILPICRKYKEPLHTEPSRAFQSYCGCDTTPYSCTIYLFSRNFQRAMKSVWCFLCMASSEPGRDFRSMLFFATFDPGYLQNIKSVHAPYWACSSCACYLLNRQISADSLHTALRYDGTNMVTSALK